MANRGSSIVRIVVVIIVIIIGIGIISIARANAPRVGAVVPLATVERFEVQVDGVVGQVVHMNVAAGAVEVAGLVLEVGVDDLVTLV